MDKLRQYFAVFFLALFVLGATAGASLAHCGHDMAYSVASDITSSEKSCETGHAHGMAKSENSSQTSDHKKQDELNLKTVTTPQPPVARPGVRFQKILL
ncbi:MAG: hypothetical protein V3T30_05340 [Thermodesulfobacteriota bacterium]